MLETVKNIIIEKLSIYNDQPISNIFISIQFVVIKVSIRWVLI